MQTKLPNHFYISDGVLTGVYEEKKATPAKVDKYTLCFYLIMVADRDSDRELFVNNSFLPTLSEMHKEKEIKPGLIEALTGIEMTNSSGLSTTELMIKKASIMAAKKSPETFCLFVTKGEKEEVDKIIEEKQYSLRVVCGEDLLKMSGIDYPLKSDFMGQLAKFNDS